MIDKVILGTVQLGLKYGINNAGEKPTMSEAFDILHAAYDNQIRTLDTAEAYGTSQDVIGNFHKKYPQKRFNIISKISPLQVLAPGEVLTRLKKNCEQLNCTQLYCYMFHNYQHFTQNKDAYEEIIEAKMMGLVQKIGISLYTNEEIEDIIDNYGEFNVIQIPFNLLDNANKREAILLKAKEKHIEVHVRSVFLQGLFFRSEEQLSRKLKPLYKYISSIKQIGANKKLITEDLALQYALQKTYIDKVLIGVDNTTQLNANISIVDKHLKIPHEEIDAINVKEEDLLNPSNWNL